MNLLNDFFEDFGKRSDRIGPIVIISIPCMLFLLFILELSAGTPDFKLIRKGVTHITVTKCGEEINISDPVLLKVFFDDLENFSKIKHESLMKFSKSIDSYVCQFLSEKGKSKIEMCFNNDGTFDFIITGNFKNDNYKAKYSNLKIRNFVDYNIKPHFHCPNK